MTLMYFIHALGLLPYYKNHLRNKTERKKESFDGFAFV
jgi:hypothetical protein